MAGPGWRMAGGDLHGCAVRPARLRRELAARSREQRAKSRQRDDSVARHGRHFRPRTEAQRLPFHSHLSPLTSHLDAAKSEAHRATHRRRQVRRARDSEGVFRLAFSSTLTSHLSPLTCSNCPQARDAGDDVRLSKSIPRQMRGEERRVQRKKEILSSPYSTSEEADAYMTFCAD